jgi:hypothetical protein
MSNINHHESLPVEINTMKNLECEHLGDRLRAAQIKNEKPKGVLYEGLRGILPVKDEFSDTFEDVVLNGKLVFYEKGMIFTDSRLHAIVMPYENVKIMTIYETEEWWLEILLVDNENIKAESLIPHNSTVQPKIYLKVNNKFYKEKFAVLEKLLLIDTDNYISKMKKSYEECPIVSTSQSWLNFLENLKYND